MIVHIKFQVHTKCLTYWPWSIYLKNISGFMGGAHPLPFTHLKNEKFNKKRLRGHRNEIFVPHNGFWSVWAEGAALSRQSFANLIQISH